MTCQAPSVVVALPAPQKETFIGLAQALFLQIPVGVEPLPLAQFAFGEFQRPQVMLGRVGEQFVGREPREQGDSAAQQIHQRITGLLPEGMEVVEQLLALGRQKNGGLVPECR